jgi:hypothetical protein
VSLLETALCVLDQQGVGGTTRATKDKTKSISQFCILGLRDATHHSKRVITSRFPSWGVGAHGKNNNARTHGSVYPYHTGDLSRHPSTFFRVRDKVPVPFNHEQLFVNSLMLRLPGFRVPCNVRRT